MNRLRRLRSTSRSDIGATLVETLVALAILSIAAVAILAGLQLSVTASDIHRKQSTGGAYVRSYAEAIEKHVSVASADNYVGCASADAYNVSAVISQLNLPSGYTAHHSAATPLTSTGSPTSCPDNGVQRLQLTVRSSDDRAVETLILVLRRPCAPGGPACA